MTLLRIALLFVFALFGFCACYGAIHWLIKGKLFPKDSFGEVFAYAAYWTVAACLIVRNAKEPKL